MRKFVGGARLAPVVGLAAATAVGLAAEAQASGFQLKEQSAEGLGNAFAGSTAKAQDLSTIFFNPAGMTALSGNQGQAVLSYIAPQAEYTDKGSTVELQGSAIGAALAGPAAGLAPFANTRVGGGFQGQANQDDAIDNAVVPAAYAMWDAREDFKVGLAVNAPFGLVTDYDDQWVGRYHALKSELKTIAVQPSVAWQASDWLSIGGGPIFQYAEAELTKAVDLGSQAFLLAGAGGLPGSTGFIANPAFDGRSKLTGDDIAMGFTAGVMLQPLETTRIGLSYRSGIEHELEGNATVRDASGSLIRDTGASAELNLPATAALGLYHDINDKLALMGEVAWTEWSDFQRLTAIADNGTILDDQPENWEDTWFFSVGATYKPVDKLKLQVGVAYDQSPVPDEFRTPRVPDEDRTWLAIGAGYEVMPGVSTNLAYTHIWVDEASIDTGNVNASSTPAHRLVGSYESSIDIISAQVVVKF